MNGAELKIERIRHNETTHDIGKILGISRRAYETREAGIVKCSIEESAILGKHWNLDENRFVDIFYDGDFPFRNLTA